MPLYYIIVGPWLFTIAAIIIAAVVEAYNRHRIAGYNRARSVLNTQIRACTRPMVHSQHSGDAAANGFVNYLNSSLVANIYTQYIPRYYQRYAALFIYVRSIKSWNYERGPNLCYMAFVGRGIKKIAAWYIWREYLDERHYIEI